MRRKLDTDALRSREEDRLIADTADSLLDEQRELATELYELIELDAAEALNVGFHLIQMISCVMAAILTRESDTEHPLLNDTAFRVVLSGALEGFRIFEEELSDRDPELMVGKAHARMLGLAIAEVLHVDMGGFDLGELLFIAQDAGRFGVDAMGRQAADRVKDRNACSSADELQKQLILLSKGSNVPTQ